MVDCSLDIPGPLVWQRQKCSIRWWRHNQAGGNETAQLCTVNAPSLLPFLLPFHWSEMICHCFWTFTSLLWVLFGSGETTCSWGFGRCLRRGGIKNRTDPAESEVSVYLFLKPNESWWHHWYGPFHRWWRQLFLVKSWTTTKSPGCSLCNGPVAGLACECWTKWRTGLCNISTSLFPSVLLAQTHLSQDLPCPLSHSHIHWHYWQGLRPFQICIGTTLSQICF